MRHDILLPEKVVIAIVGISEKTKSKVLEVFKSKIVNYVVYIAEFSEHIAFISKTGCVLLETLKVEFEKLVEEFECISYIRNSAVKIIGINATERGSVSAMISCFKQNNNNLLEDV